MAFRDKIISAASNAAGIDAKKAEIAVRQALDMIRSKMPAHVATPFADMLDSANGATAWPLALSPGQAPTAPVLIPAVPRPAPKIVLPQPATPERQTIVAQTPATPAPVKSKVQMSAPSLVQRVKSYWTS